MSTIMNMRRIDARLQLLTTASVAALLFSAYGSAEALAAGDDTDRPTVWIEVGGQLDGLDVGQQPFAPPFFDTVTSDGFPSPQKLIKPTQYSIGLVGGISLQPKESDWVFSANIRYGRSNSHKYVHDQNPGQVTHFSLFGKYQAKTAPPQYLETNATNSESHLIAVFQAGKDVGLGTFGHEVMSTFNFGVRFANFSSRSEAAIHARPDVHFVPGSAYSGLIKIPLNFYHEYYASAHRAQSFHGVGPSISWKASASLAGEPSAGEVNLDWGVNAALLFGRQKTQTHHYTSGSYRYYPSVHNAIVISSVPLQPHHGSDSRTRSVVVPNVGGFAGLSLRYSGAKISLGYRADFFFGAMDGGIDARKTYDRNFYGPFATISIGLP